LWKPASATNGAILVGGCLVVLGEKGGGKNEKGEKVATSYVCSGTYRRKS